VTTAIDLPRGVLLLDHIDLRDRERWLAARKHGIGASEIPVILGLPPWDSPFSLYWRKKLGGELEMTDAMEWGTRLEDPIAEKFAECHPEYTVHPGGLYRHAEHHWMLATPDRRLRPKDDSPGELLQLKTAYDLDGWGEPGTDDVPLYYRAQVMQEMAVYGAPRCWLVVLAGGTRYREYVVKYDPTDAETLRAAGEAFMRRLADNDPPPIDAAKATTDTLKVLHANVVDELVSIPQALADQYRARKELLDDAQRNYDEAANQIRDALGAAKTAVCDGQRVATRSVYERHGFDAKTFKTDHPDLYRDYETTTTVDALKPCKEPKT
jgi:putative phage-type endonuclease